jgi:hypothetical protein
MEQERPVKSALALRILGRATEKLGRANKDFNLVLSGKRAQARTDREDSKKKETKF